MGCSGGGGGDGGGAMGGVSIGLQSVARHRKKEKHNFEGR